MVYWFSTPWILQDWETECLNERELISQARAGSWKMLELGSEYQGTSDPWGLIWTQEVLTTRFTFCRFSHSYIAVEVIFLNVAFPHIMVSLMYMNILLNIWLFCRIEYNDFPTLPECYCTLLSFELQNTTTLSTSNRLWAVYRKWF